MNIMFWGFFVFVLFCFVLNRHYERYEVSKTIEEQPGQSFADRYV